MKEEEQVRLRVTGFVERDGLPEEEMELITEGTRSVQEGETVLTYMESEISGMQGTQTSVRVQPERVSIIRLGSVNSIMEYEVGKKNVTMYQTAHGDLSMSMSTQAIDVDYDEDQQVKEIRIEYEIDLQDFGASKNQIAIKIEPMS